MVLQPVNPSHIGRNELVSFGCEVKQQDEKGHGTWNA